MLRIINNRLKNFLHTQIPQEQTGFMPGKGTREQILKMRLIIEKAREFNKPTFLCFLDYAKAFDSVVWNKLFSVLEEMGVPHHLSRLIENLYRDNTASVKVNGAESSNFVVGKGVRQGCIVSPYCSSIYIVNIL